MDVSWTSNPLILVTGIGSFQDLMPLLDDGSMTINQYINGMTRLSLFTVGIWYYMTKTIKPIIGPAIASLILLTLLARRRPAIKEPKSLLPSIDASADPSIESNIVQGDPSPPKDAERFITMDSRQSTSRSFIAPTVEEESYANRPTASLADINITQGEPHWQSGQVGIYKTTMKVV